MKRIIGAILLMVLIALIDNHNKGLMLYDINGILSVLLIIGVILLVIATVAAIIGLLILIHWVFFVD